MIINTRDFGEILATENDLIIFDNGMYGFEDYTKYLILRDDPKDDIMYLQSVENIDLSFVLIDPYSIIKSYEPKLNEEDLAELKVSDEGNLKFLVIAIISEDIKKSVVNLKSPISINPELKIAKQVIVQNTYPLRYKIFNAEEDK